ncbi:BTAD domain-containing putative transcriptional regulator [Roseiflexus sp.]|uniref:BTAD domain-containing putative transcriptional regulator n=1 Tax=Roseiflexus sp. TaxID=2562120 RepID=UPI00398B608B
MEALLFTWAVGGILGFWVCFFLGSRTAYHPLTRWLRWSFVFAGFHFLFAAIEALLDHSDHEVVTSLRVGTGLIAITCWHGWIVGVRGLTRKERIVRKVHLCAALSYALCGVAISLISADATLTGLTVEPWVASVPIGVYLAGALVYGWRLTWRLHQRETLPVARSASGKLLTATTIVCVSVIPIAGLSVLKRTFPEVAAPVEQAGYGSLCCGIALMGYGSLTYARRRTGLVGGRDYLVSGFASLGIVVVYESVLVAFYAVMPEKLAVNQVLVLGVVLIPVIITTHFGLDQLRDMLDWLRFGRSARQVRRTLRVITRLIGAEKPRDQVIHDVLQTLARTLCTERIALFWFTKGEAHVLSALGPPPEAPLYIDDLLATRLQLMPGCDGYEYLLPLCVGRRQRGALLIGGSGSWRWWLNERERLEAAGVLLADYIEYTESEPDTIPQHVDRFEQQIGTVQSLHEALDQVQSPPVFITTLGSFKVEVNGKPAPYQGVRVGRHMLNGMLMYLVAHVDRPVLRDILIEVADVHRRGRKGRKAGQEWSDRSHYISGLRQIQQQWGMTDALEISDTTVMLKRHPSWTTDTDQVVKLHQRAEQARAEGRISDAIALLEEALALFHGDYLPEFESGEVRIDDAVRRWERIRERIERQLFECYLTTPHLSDDDCHRIPDIVDGIQARNDGDPHIAALAERVIQRCRNSRPH